MADKAIRGITVEIGGDTTKLGKAIGESEKQTRSLQTELRQIEKLLKFDPTNTELLIQKQNVLADMISETSKKLDVMKEAEAQVIAQFERGEIAEDQLRAFQREIIQTEKTLGDMKAELQTATRNLEEFGDNNGVAKEETKKLEAEIREQNEALEAEKKALKDAEQAHKDHEKAVADAKEELADFKDKASGAFGMLATGTLAVGGAVVAGAGYAVKLSTDFDKAFNTLITKTGASTDEMDGLNESMEAVYANNFGESIEDVAESMATVKTNTKLTGEELQKTTEHALLLRDTFGFEVNESTRSAKMLMDQFGVSADEAYNLIAQGAQNGLDKNGDLLDTVNEYSVHFKQLGIDAPTMFNMLVNGAESGTFSVDKLGDAVKEFGIRAKDGSETTKVGFETIGLNADDMAKKFAKGGDSAKEALKQTVTALFNLEDPIAQNTAGVNLFGTMWEDLGVDGVKALMNMTGEIGVTKTALEDINNVKYDDVGSAIQGLGRTFETDVIAPLGEELTPVVEEVIDVVKDNAPQIKEFLADIVKDIGKFVSFLIDDGPQIVSIIGAIGAGFVTWKVSNLINSAVKAIKAFKVANEAATISQKALNGAMKANIIGLIVTAIVTLISMFVLLWQNCEGFRNFWIGLWEGIKNAFKAFIVWIGPAIEVIKEFFQLLWEKIKVIWDRILVSLKPLGDAISGAFKEAWELIKVIWDKVGPYFRKIWDVIKTVFAFVKEFFVDGFKKAWEGIKVVWSVAVSYFRTIWENIKIIFSVVKTFFVETFKTAWVGIKAIWNGVVGYFTAIWKTIKGIFSVVKNVLTGNWRDAWNGIKGIVNTWKSYFSGVWNSIKTVFGSVKTWFTNVFSSAWNGIKKIFSNWGSFFSGLWDKIKNTFSAIGTKIGNAISGAVKSGINGVISAIENTINGGVNLINGAINLINKIPGVSIGKISKLSLPRLARGGIVDSPTVAEIGENGREAIIPLEKNTGWIRELAYKLNDYQLAHGNANGALLDKLDGIYERLGKLQIVLDTGTLVGETIDKIDAELGEMQLLRERGV